jgi:hypothetical protein
MLMNLYFTTETFLKNFGKYNQDVFPVQIVFYLLSFFILYLIVRRKYASSMVISLILGFFWIWMGFVFHILYFSEISNAAYLFGALFILQGSFFIYSGVFKDNLEFVFRKDFSGMVAWILILYALFIYPLIGHFGGLIYPDTPELSAPCPTTIFTFGILLFSSDKTSRLLLIIPLIWSLIGFTAALNFEITQDYGLPAAGIIVFLLLTFRDYRKRKVQTAVSSGI